MKKSSKAKLISTVLTLSCTAVLLGFAATSVAWFSTNTEVQVNGAKVKCYIDDTVGILSNSFDIYGYDIEEDTPVKMDNLSLGDYDAFIAKNNVYAKRFVRAQLYYPNTIHSGEQLEIKVECEPNHLFKTIIDGQTQHQYIDKYISNLIEFNFLDNFDKSIEQESPDGSNIPTIYNQCVEEFAAIADRGITFVDTEIAPSTENDKNIVISTKVNLPSSAVGVAGYTTDFFIQYNYSDVLVNFYRSRCEDDYNLDVFQKSNIIEFEKDIVSISFALTRN